MALAVEDLKVIEAGEILQKRRKARTSLLDFASLICPEYQRSTPHIALAAKLEAVSRGEINRLLVSMPRRHGKSKLVSVLWPVWSLGINPQLRIVQCGYAENLCLTHSRQARDIMARDPSGGTKPYHRIFPTVADREISGSIYGARQAAHEWGTSQGGSYYAVGVGGGLAGRGYHVGIIDDFFKGRKEASSKLQRDTVYDWFRSVFYPAQDSDSIRKHAAIVITATRWHRDDLIGRLLKSAESDIASEDGYSEKWDMISMPAINAQGEALWPERWPLAKLMRIQKLIGLREWCAQYQQDPKDLDSGGVIKRDWFEIVGASPARAAKVRSWDLAHTVPLPGHDPDWTAGPKITLDQGVWYIEDLQRFQGTPQTVRSRIRQTAELDGRNMRIIMEQEPAAGIDVIDDFRRNILPGFYFVGVTPIRARAGGNWIGPLSSAAEAGNVKLVRGPWINDWLDECEAYGTDPKAHDDQLIAAAQGMADLSVGGTGEHSAGTDQAERDPEEEIETSGPASAPGRRIIIG